MTHDNIPLALLAIICLGYLVVAFQFFFELRKRQGAGKRGLALFVSIFALCAICGYGARIFDVPYMADVALHISLGAATWWFIVTKQARNISESLD